MGWVSHQSKGIGILATYQYLQILKQVFGYGYYPNTKTIIYSIGISRIKLFCVFWGSSTYIWQLNLPFLFLDKCTFRWPPPPPEYSLFSFVYSTTPSPLCLALSVFLFLSVNSTQADLNSTSFVYSSTQPDFMSPPHTNHLLASLFVVIGSQKGSYITFNFSRW